MKKYVAAIFSVILASSSFAILPTESNAAVSSWQQGGTMLPLATTSDFGTDNFRASAAKLKDTGAEYLTLIVTYYQSNNWSTDIHRGWNTPTDESLISAIDYAHSIGLKVNINIHVNPYGEWRAHIDPSDRQAWFIAYGNILDHYARMAEAHGAEMITIGSELVRMSTTSNPTNTQNWEDLIVKVRAIYSGKLTYSANWGGSWTNDEKNRIDFWDKLDYIGISAYFNLDTWDNSVGSLKAEWDKWNNSDIAPLQQRWGKPVLFTEIGYKSVTNSHREPWNGEYWGNPDETEQANAYEALFSYWNDKPWMVGVHLWDWEIDPNAGGPGTRGYTPQNKKAEGVMRKWFSTPSTPSEPTPTPVPSSFGSSGSITPTTPAPGQTSTLNVSLMNSGGTINGVADIEIYDSSNQKVFQQFFENQTFAGGQANNYVVQWTAAATGDYRVTAGVFNASWSQNYHWNDALEIFTVSGAENSPTPVPTATPTPTSPPSNNTDINIWWPSNGANVTGIQPFKGVIDGRDLGQYNLYWQVDGDRLNIMGDSNVDWPHKEALVDLSGWNWNSEGLYHLNFVAKDLGGNMISQRSVDIYTK